MESRSDSQRTKRVQLPSGKTIEVVYFDEDSPSVDLHVCGVCESPLAQPVEWEPVERGRWRVETRCPSCGHRGDGVYDQDTVDRFDDALEEGTAALTEDLARLTRANMEEEAELLAAALAADAVLPEDF